MSAPKEIEEMSLPELQAELKLRVSAPSYRDDNPTAVRIKTALQVRLAELQDRSAQALVDATDQLGRTTGRLVWATWGLVGATAALVIVEAVLTLLGKH